MRGESRQTLTAEGAGAAGGIASGHRTFSSAGVMHPLGILSPLLTSCRKCLFLHRQTASVLAEPQVSRTALESGREKGPVALQQHPWRIIADRDSEQMLFHILSVSVSAADRWVPSHCGGKHENNLIFSLRCLQCQTGCPGLASPNLPSPIRIQPPPMFFFWRLHAAPVELAGRAQSQCRCCSDGESRCTVCAGAGALLPARMCLPSCWRDWFGDSHSSRWRC